MNGSTRALAVGALVLVVSLLILLTAFLMFDIVQAVGAWL